MYSLPDGGLINLAIALDMPFDDGCQVSLIGKLHNYAQHIHILVIERLLVANYVVVLYRRQDAYLIDSVFPLPLAQRPNFNLHYMHSTFLRA